MNQTVGKKLRAAREARGISLPEAVKATHISMKYLQELENDHPEMFNSGAQARGFLRLYASFLGIPHAPLIEQWDSVIVKEPDISDIQEIAKEEGSGLESEAGEDEVNTEEEEESGKKEEAVGKAKAPFSLSKWIGEKLSLAALLGRNVEEGQTIGAEEPEPAPESEEISDSSEPDRWVDRSAEEIFKDIGAALRERRDALELTLSDVERYTNVKRMYLIAMEEGRFDDLPSTVQGRGMLNIFSKFIALDDSWVMDAYSRALQSLREEHVRTIKRPIQPPLTVRLNIPERWRRLLNPDLIIGSVLIMALFGFIIWGGAQVFGGGTLAPTEAPSISEMLQQTPTNKMEMEEDGLEQDETPAAVETPIPGVTIAESTPTQIATVNAAPLQLYILAHDRAYLRIDVDGVEAFNGRVTTGNVYTYSGEETIELVSGNGAALEVYFNQEYLGSLGDVGEVVNISFSLQGLRTATPKPEPTATVEVEDAMMEEMMEDF
jgi:cytoskeletal protein RodZ